MESNEEAIVLAQVDYYGYALKYEEIVKFIWILFIKLIILKKKLYLSKFI